MGLNEEPAFQDLTETTENKKPPTAQNYKQQLLNFEFPDFYSGEIRAVGVAIYSDSSLNSPLSSIDCGTLELGANKNIKCYIQNTGKTAAILTLETANWTPPEATTHIALAWDYDGKTLNIDEVIQVTSVLKVSENIEEITTFVFDNIIIGSAI